MLKVDRLTSIHDRGKFACICVELDLDKQLSSHIVIRGVKIPLEYEGLHSICFRCGRYDHKKDQCSELLEQPESNLSTHQRDTSVSTTNKGASDEMINVQIPQDTGMVVDTPVVQSDADAMVVEASTKIQDLDLGPWNLVTSRTISKNGNPLPRTKANPILSISQQTHAVGSVSSQPQITDSPGFGVLAELADDLPDFSQSALPPDKVNPPIPATKGKSNSRICDPNVGKNKQSGFRSKPASRKVDSKLANTKPPSSRRGGGGSGDPPTVAPQSLNKGKRLVERGVRPSNFGVGIAGSSSEAGRHMVEIISRRGKPDSQALLDSLNPLGLGHIDEENIAIADALQKRTNIPKEPIGKASSNRTVTKPMLGGKVEESDPRSI